MSEMTDFKTLVSRSAKPKNPVGLQHAQFPPLETCIWSNYSSIWKISFLSAARLRAHRTIPIVASTSTMTTKINSAKLKAIPVCIFWFPSVRVRAGCDSNGLAVTCG